MRLLQNPKELSNAELFYLIQNLFPEKAPENVKIWYKKVEEEFYSRDIKLEPIMDVTYPLPKR